MNNFKNLEQFSNYLTKITTRFEPLKKEAMGIIGEILVKKAKDKFGHYQRGTVYQEWAELSPYTKADRVREGYPENEPLLREGDLRESIHHLISLNGNNLVVYSDDEIMVYQELGTLHIPPRSVLGLTAFESIETVAPVLKKMMLAWFKNEKLLITKPL